MAKTAAGARLTAEYRRDLRAQAGRVSRIIAKSYEGMDVANIDASMRRILPQAAVAITGGQGRAAATSYAYLRRFIAAELGRAVEDIAVPAFDTRTLVGKTVTGKTVAEAVSFEPAYAKTQILRHRKSAEEAVAVSLRHLQKVGRSELYRVANQELIDTAAETEHVTRYQRITSANACDFCTMLAGRGAVYRLSTVGFRAHGNCGCTAEPVVIENERAAFWWREETA